MKRHYEITKDGKHLATITAFAKGSLFTGEITSDNVDYLNEISEAFDLKVPSIPEIGFPFIRIHKADFNKIMGLS